MPLYQYECVRGHQFETFNKIGCYKKSTCPECGNEAKVVISMTNMRMAQPFRVVDSDGNLLHYKADGGISPPPGQPYTAGG